MRNQNLNQSLPSPSAVFEDRSYPVPASVLEREARILEEQAKRDGLVIDESAARLTTDDSALVAAIVDEITEQPAAFAARFVALERTVARYGEWLGSLSARV